VQWPSSVQAAFHLVFSTTHVPFAGGFPVGQPLPSADCHEHRSFHELPWSTASPLASTPSLNLFTCPIGAWPLGALLYRLWCVSWRFPCVRIPCPRAPRTPPHDLLRTVSAARLRLCSASGSVGDHDLHALSLSRSLWEQAQYSSLSLACASLFLMGHSTSRGASLSLFAPGWIGGALRLVFVEASKGVAPCLVGKTQ